MSLRIYTRTGDEGETGLYGGARVAKDHVRVEAYGTVDELNSALGLALVVAKGTPLSELLTTTQHQLFELGAELATPPAKARPSMGVTAEDVRQLEHEIDRFEAMLSPLKAFVLPGGTELAARLHVCRGVCRRAERRVMTLCRAEPETPRLAVTYLNRLGDLLFVIARVANNVAGLGDVLWQSRKS